MAYSELIFSDVLWPDFRREISSLPSSSISIASDVSVVSRSDLPARHAHRGGVVVRNTVGARLQWSVRTRRALAIPAILGTMIALGVALQRFMGIAPRRPRFAIQRMRRSRDRDPRRRRGPSHVSSQAEADRVVVLWTRNFGKVRVLAKGVRKTTSRLGATLETLAYVKADLVKTRGEFYIARHVAHTERLSTLRGSYSRISAGYAVVEAIDAIPSDGVADEAIFDLLTRVLLTLDDESYDPRSSRRRSFFDSWPSTAPSLSSMRASTADAWSPWCVRRGGRRHAL